DKLVTGVQTCALPISWLSVGTSGRPSHRAMTVDELRRLARSPLVTIGAHTVHHPSLAVECITRQREEIEDSRHQLEAWTGRAIRSEERRVGKECRSGG